MPKRSLFQMIFGNNIVDTSKYQTLQLLNNSKALWTNFDGCLYDDAQIRSCIDVIARNGAKLNPKHIRYTETGIENVKGRIHRLISRKPNEVMNAYDFYYKVISELYLNNNAFIYIMRDSQRMPIALYPIRSGMYKLLEYNNNVYIQFTFRNGKKLTASLKDDVIHLRRFYCKEDIIGNDNTPIIRTMSIKHIFDEGIINAIKTTQGIKGILKTTKAMLKPEDIKKTRDQFVKDFIENGNGTGIAMLDATSDFESCDINPQTATDVQMEQFDNRVLNYFGLNNNILSSNYNEDTWASFYESVIEPIAIQMGMEFTNKIFSYGEIWHGNEIVFEANRLQYASANTKIKLARYMNNYMTINEIREVFNLAPIENGDQLAIDVNHTLQSDLESEDDLDE